MHEPGEPISSAAPVAMGIDSLDTGAINPPGFVGVGCSMGINAHARASCSMVTPVFASRRYSVRVAVSVSFTKSLNIYEDQ